MLRGPFKYPGSKFACLDQLLPLIPYKKTFVEVFGGTAVVTLNREPSQLEVVNDRYGPIIAFFRVLRDHPGELLDRLEQLPHSRELWEDSHVNFNDTKYTDMQRAVMWYYCVQNSFIGKGQVWARITKPSSDVAGTMWNKLPLLAQIHKRIHKVQFENQDWRECFNDYDSPDTVFYCDPPYLNSDCGTYKGGFPISEHHALMQRIQKVKGIVCLSGYPNTVYPLYKWTTIHTLELRDKANANVACVDNNRDDCGSHNMRIEKLWIRDPAAL